MTNIEKIRQEVERLKNIAENDNASEYLRGQARVCRVILAFIDSLPEECLADKRKTSDEPVIDSHGLEEEIQGMYQAIFGTDIINRREMVYLETFDMIARHFAEWGARHSINWADIQLLDIFILELSREEKDGADWGDSEKFYTEVLRRFHEFNDKKIPEIVAEWEAKHLK
jgi:hypothetical protein